jgi:hypothetical protein
MTNPLAELAESGIRAGSGFEKLAAPIGGSVPGPLVLLMRQSGEAFDAVTRFTRASERLRVSADEAALAAFRREAEVLEDLAPKLPLEERNALLAELRLRRAPYEPPAPAATTEAITRPKAGTALENAVRGAEASRLQAAASVRLRRAAADRGSAAAIEKSDAIDRIGGVIGGAEGDGWQPAYEYLTTNAQAIAQAEQRYSAAIDALAKGQGPKAQLEKELADALTARRGFHSKLKGILGEAYASRCGEWLDLRDAFFELATHRVGQLNRAARRVDPDNPVLWEVVSAKGRLYIDSLEAWDEAVLIVERLRPGMNRLPRAELVVAAQYKVEKRVSALKQIAHDAEREAGAPGAPAIFTQVLENGAKRSYQLIPPAGTSQPTRFLFNAEGGTVSAAEVARFTQGKLRAQQGTLRASVGQFGLVADEMLAATAAFVR